MQCFVGKDSAGQIVSIIVHGGKPPHRLEGDDLLHANLLMNGARELCNILETSLFKELEDLTIPFIVFE